MSAEKTGERAVHEAWPRHAPRMRRSPRCALASTHAERHAYQSQSADCAGICELTQLADDARDPSL
eukprot:13439959-Alexandrium_andersonii.AAC.1